jgi:O-antigen/teichoic acid export membrane protein
VDAGLELSTVTRNLAASLLATGWTSLVQLAVVPALIGLVGVASFALVGFYGVLIAALGVLDFGLSLGLTRKMAGMRLGGDEAMRAADTLRTYEIVFCAAGLTIGAAIVLAAPFVARIWLSSTVLLEADIRDCVRLMGLLVALRWPMAPYTAALQGLQKQVDLNVLNAAALTVAGFGGVALLMTVDPSIKIFFAWQALCTAIHLLLLRRLALRELPRAARRGRFAGGTVTEGWRFSSGITVLTLTIIILTQTDKLILSKLVTLEEFGYFSIALVVASALHIITLPVFNAILPKLYAHASADDEAGLRSSFASACALMNALFVPAALLLILFPNEILQLWIRDPETASRAGPLLALLATGTLLNGFMNVPFALQLARGNTAVGVRINLVLCVLMVPAILALTLRFGIVGGAAVSPILNGLYLLAGMPLTYKLCLGSRQWTAFYANLARQQGAAILLLLAARLAFPSGAQWLAQALALAGVFVAALSLSIAFTPAAREFLLEFARPERRA